MTAGYGGFTSAAAEACPMIGGDGPRSYQKNSSLQKMVADAAKELINEGIKDKLDFHNLGLTPGSFRIADFGCSTGPNTFFAMENITRAVEHTYLVQLSNSPPLEFQVFFNDLPDNDFNTLFRTLPPYNKYFAAGVPGSFYSRLFPKSSLQFAYSCYALHWLSEVPKEIVDSQSPAWNKGSIHCTGLVKEVAKAYSAQFRNDMTTFLKARAEEIVSGGLMVILVGGLPEGVLMSQTRAGMMYDFLGSCLTDMAKMGLISEDKADSFNLPLYFSSAKEIEEIVESNGFFSIARIEEFNLTHVSQLLLKEMKSPAEFIVSQTRVIFEGLLRQHFGDETIVDDIFNCFGKKLAENDPIAAKEGHLNVEIFALLKRKTDQLKEEMDPYPFVSTD